MKLSLYKMLQYALATQASNQQNFPLHTARTSCQAQGLGPFDQCVSRTLPKYLTDLISWQINVLQHKRAQWNKSHLFRGRSFLFACFSSVTDFGCEEPSQAYHARWKTHFFAKYFSKVNACMCFCCYVFKSTLLSKAF